jgi:RimJ/RimL family protein N-acetyltransferase
MDELRLERWTAEDFPLLDRFVGDPAMMEHLGGPESAARMAERQQRYERGEGVFKVVDVETGEVVAWVGYWPTGTLDEPELEMGWAVLPEFQGRGIATGAAGLCIAAARAAGKRGAMTAHPDVANGPSNAVCRKLGFELLGETELEYPPGRPFRANRWRLEL